jgi:sterol desaturase/sphingolipid hydroxylase (fatty acid hydroxylase superfamily)
MTGPVFSATHAHRAMPGGGATPAKRLFHRLRAACTPARLTAAGALATLPLLLKNPTQAAALALTLLISATMVAGQRLRRRGRIRPRLLLRAIFPRRLFTSPSMAADVGMTFLNCLVTGGLIGWALISAQAVAAFVFLHLGVALGPPRIGGLNPGWVSPGWARAWLTVALFLAAEFAYWLDHYLSHKVPFLWEFHRVHHTAESLTPLTVFRVHPIDSLVFYNISGLFIGLTQGALAYVLGYEGPEYLMLGINALTYIFVLFISNLLHTQVWIAFTGPLGRLLISPAHHQLHHSMDPAHHGRNMGNALAVFDWLFGTLHVPQRQKEKLVFGVPPGPEAPHSIIGTMLAPCLAAWAHLRGNAARADFKRLSRLLPSLRLLTQLAGEAGPHASGEMPLPSQAKLTLAE